jgi:hypothetical protein
MEENGASAPTTVFPRIEDCLYARNGLRQEPGRDRAAVSAQPQTLGNVEKRVACQRRAAFPGKGARPEARLDAEHIAELERKVGQQAMEIDFLKKVLQRFKETPLRAVVNGGAESTSKSRKPLKRRTM